MTRESLQEELLRIWEAERRTCLFVTHSIGEAVFLADRVIVMTPRPGRIARDLQIDIPRPRSWNAVHESAAFQQYVREVREIFEAQGVLVAH